MPLGAGGTCDAATITYAGSGGTLAQCDAVLDAIGGPGSTVDTTDFFGVGCAYRAIATSGGPSRVTSPGTTCAAISILYERACACH